MRGLKLRLHPGAGVTADTGGAEGRAGRREESERAVFADFAEVAGLRCTSVKSRRPPEPDILCDIAGDGAIAFELGIVASEMLERATNEQSTVRRHFQAAYAKLPPADRQRIEEGLGGVPAVFVGFVPDTPPGRWRRAVAPVLELLVARTRETGGADRLRQGDLDVWRVPALSDLLTDLTVRRAPTRRPFFGVLEMVEMVDATHRMLTKKFAASYISAAPMELLLYWAASPTPRTPQWREDLLASIRAGLSTSRFRRVWCFDLFNRAVVLVYPAPAENS